MIYTQPKITFFSPRSSVTQISTEGVSCFKQNEPVPAINQPTLDLLVWNIHKGSDAGWQGALSRFAEKKDMVLLQEISPHIETDTSLATDFFTRLYISSFAYKGKESGIGILSRFVPQTYCVGMGKEPWIRIPKVGVAMIFPVKNHAPLLVINLHLINFELNPTYYKTQLTQMLSLITHHQGAVILAGDFNAWSEKRYQLIQKMSEKYGLQEVKFTPDYRLSFLSHPLDFVFVRGMDVLSATTEKTKASDHNPLILQLMFKPD